MANFALADDSAPAAAATPTVSQPASQATPATKILKVKKSKKAAKEIWVCPMDGYTSNKPGKCPQCGMDLEKVEPTPVKKDESKPSAQAEEKKTVWVCPMGDYTSDKPGKCPNCGMDLVEKKQ